MPTPTPTPMPMTAKPPNSPFRMHGPSDDCVDDAQPGKQNKTPKFPFSITQARGRVRGGLKDIANAKRKIIQNANTIRVRSGDSIQISKT